MNFTLALFIGAIIGVIVNNIVYGIIFLRAGDFVIDDSDPDVKKYNLEITVPLEKLENSNYILLKIRQK